MFPTCSELLWNCLQHQRMSLPVPFTHGSFAVLRWASFWSHMKNEVPQAGFHSWPQLYWLPPTVSPFSAFRAPFPLFPGPAAPLWFLKAPCSLGGISEPGLHDPYGNNPIYLPSLSLHVNTPDSSLLLSCSVVNNTVWGPDCSGQAEEIRKAAQDLIAALQTLLCHGSLH